MPNIDLLLSNIKTVHQKSVFSKNKVPKLVAVSKKQEAHKIDQAILYGQKIFGENRVQEATNRWKERLEIYKDLELRLIGPLQTNKVKQSIKLMAKADEGILIYLAQEGRDIGLLNKLRAYSLQENGMDTVEANEDLGFNDDERLYYPAKEILEQLRIKNVKLITNNPKKVEHLKNLGSMLKRVPVKITPNKHNKNIFKQNQKNQDTFFSQSCLLPNKVNQFEQG